MGIYSGVAHECIVIIPQCPSYTNGSQDSGSAEAVSLELSEDMFPNKQSPSAMGKIRPTTKDSRSERESPGNITWSLIKLYLKMKLPVDVPDTWAYWLSRNLALPNSCIRLLLYFNDTNHKCYKISVETKIAIGWIDQKTSERWILCKTPKEKEGREEADFRKEEMVPRGRKQSKLVLLK